MPRWTDALQRAVEIGHRQQILAQFPQPVAIGDGLAHATLQRLVQFAQRVLGLGALGDFRLRRLIEPRVVDGDGRLRRDPHHDALGAGVEYARLRMAEQQAADHLARARDHRRSEVAADRQMARRHAVKGSVPAVTRILRHIVDADDTLAFEGGREQRSVAGLRQTRERFFRRAGERVQHVAAAIIRLHVIEERAEGGAGKLRRRVGHHLHSAAQVEFRGHRRTDTVENFQRPRLFAQTAFGFPAQARQLQIARHARQQFARRERLGQIVVGAGFETAHARLFPGAGRQQQHRRFAQVRVAAQFAQQTEAVEPRHHHI